MSDSKTWIDELEFMLSDEMFPEGSIMQMNPDIIRDGIGIMRKLKAELEKQRQISYDLAMSEAALVAKVNKLTKDSDEENRLESQLQREVAVLVYRRM